MYQSANGYECDDRRFRIQSSPQLSCQETRTYQALHRAMTGSSFKRKQKPRQQSEQDMLSVDQINQLSQHRHTVHDFASAHNPRGGAMEESEGTAPCSSLYVCLTVYVSVAALRKKESVSGQKKRFHESVLFALKASAESVRAAESNSAARVQHESVRLNCFHL